MPLMLGKLIGGILAAAGFGGLVYVSTRPPKPAALSIMLYAAAGIAGVAIFVFCSRIVSSQTAKQAPDGEGIRTAGSKVLPWAILLALAAIFVIIMLLI